MKIKKYSISIAMVFLVSPHIAIATYKGAQNQTGPIPPKRFNSSSHQAKGSQKISSAADGEQVNDYVLVDHEESPSQPSEGQAPAGNLALSAVNKTPQFVVSQNKSKLQKESLNMQVNGEDGVNFGDTYSTTKTFAGNNPLQSQMKTSTNFSTVHDENTSPTLATSTDENGSQPNARKSRNPYAQSTNLEAKPVPSQDVINAISLARKPPKPYKTNKKAPTKEDVKQVNLLGPDQYGFMEFSDTPEYREYITSDSNINDYTNRSYRSYRSSRSGNQKLIGGLKTGTMIDKGNSVEFIVDGEIIANVKKPNVYKPKSSIINKIIDKSRNLKEMEQSFSNLIANTDNPDVLNDIQKLYSDSNKQAKFKGDLFPSDKFSISNAAANRLHFIENQNNIKSILELSNLKISDSDRISELENAFNTGESEKSFYVPLTHGIRNQNPKIIEMYTAAIEKATNPLIQSVLDDAQLSLNGKINKLQSLKKNYTELTHADFGAKRILKESYRQKLAKLYDEEINKLQTEGVSIDRLHLDISTLKENSNKALSSFMSTGSGADLSDFMSNSLMALWKRGAVTSKTIGQTLNNLFRVSKTEVSQDLIDNMTADLAADVPTQKSNIEQQAHWFTRASNKVSQAISDTIDTIYGAKRPTQKEQDILRKIYDADYEASARKLVENPGGAQDSLETIMSILKKANPDLAPISIEHAAQIILQSEINWATKGQFDPAKFKKWSIEQIRRGDMQYDLLGNPLSSTY